MNLHEALKVLDKGKFLEPTDWYGENAIEAFKVLRAAARRRPMRIELNYTKHAEWAKEHRDEFYSFRKDETQTALTTIYPNGEHAQTSPEKRDVKVGRKAAKTLERYMLAEIVDLTK